MPFNRPQPQLAIISTPVEEDDIDTDTKHVPSPPGLYNSWSTPSPQSVEEFENSTFVTSANRSPVVSRMLSDHLVTVNDEEVLASSSHMALPELEEARCANAASQRIRTPVRSALAVRKHMPPIPVQHKMLYQSVSSLASPIRVEDCMPQLHVEMPERTVVFHAASIGIKISRHTDGYVRVLSVAPSRSAVAVAGEAATKVREGEICKGDVVREVGDVNLRMPIDSAVWKLTVGLIKMAPRPLKFVVARELHISTEAEEEVGAAADAGKASLCNPLITGMDDRRFGPTREVHFFEAALGIKLHHNAEGYVQILSVAPYKSFPNSPLARTGEMKGGDIVLEVGGVWNLREPIDNNSWAVLIEYIQDTRRPLCMVVADGGGAPTIVSVETEERQDKQQSNSLSGGSSDDDDDVRGKLCDGSDGKEAPEEHERGDAIPDLCKILNEQLSFDALQKELTEKS